VKTPADAESWFEAVDWVVSAREARDRYVIITLGANYGAQAVGAYRALQAVNPLPFKLVAVEPVPGNLEWIKRHMRKSQTHPQGAIVEREGTIHISNVMKAEDFDARAARRGDATPAAAT